jgi:CubicO group peptidase (beta-lactamase class C family)
MPHLSRNLRLVVIGAALAVVAANVLIRTPATQVAGGPSTDAGIDAWFDTERRDAGIPGAAVVVVRDGVVHAAGFGTADSTGRPVDAHTPFLLGSVSKGITALAVSQLAERGVIDLDAPVHRYLPEFALADPTDSAAITIRQLLDQTSGIPTAAGVMPLSEPETTLDARVRDLATVAPVSVPGAAYHYSNANYVVLGRLVEVVSGRSFEAYLQAHVFAPLGMDHASADPATSAIDGLGDAHRLWFGLADTHRPLDRADLAPAGFVSASADDVGRYLAALLDPAGPGGGSVASAGTVASMFAGTAPTGVGDERYGLGWAETTYRGERIVAHAGSTTDMASFVAINPARGVAVAVLFDAQSPLYELLHKPDQIGLGVLAMTIGEAPDGTLEGFYPIVDIALAAILGLMAWRLVVLVRSPRIEAGDWRPRRRWSGPLRIGGLALRAYLDVVVPLAILLTMPAFLGAGWPVLIRTDLGLVLAVIATLRVADGAIRAWRWRLGFASMGTAA